MKDKNLFRSVGDSQQLFGIKDYTFNEGKAKNVRALEMYNSEGIQMTVLPDRGMDIASLSYKGKNLSFLSKTGIVSPAFFVENSSIGFFKNFFAGFLTTGGLSYMGAPCYDNGQELGLHGTISNTPAYNVSYFNNYSDGILLGVTGKVKEAQVFGEHLILTRTISYDENANSIYIQDKIKNYSFEPAPFMILYHMNFGFPFLSPDLEIKIPSKKITPRDKDSVLQNYKTVSKPIDQKVEEVFFHEMLPDEKGNVAVTLSNSKLGVGVELTYPYEELPYLTQWKSMKSGEYALGIEPGNYNVMGRSDAKEKDRLIYLDSMEEKNICLKIRLFDI